MDGKNERAWDGCRRHNQETAVGASQQQWVHSWGRSASEVRFAGRYTDLTWVSSPEEIDYESRLSELILLPDDWWQYQSVPFS